MYSLAVNDIELLRWFLEHGAYPNATAAFFDLTPLSEAIHHGSYEAIEMMFEYHGSVEHGQLLYCAAGRCKEDRDRVLNLLFNKGVKGLNLRMYENQPTHVFDFAKRFDMYTPLQRAAALGFQDAVKCLLQKGARTDLKSTRYGKLAVDIARENNHPDIASLLEDQAVTSRG